MGKVVQLAPINIPDTISMSPLLTVTTVGSYGQHPYNNPQTGDIVVSMSRSQLEFQCMYILNREMDYVRKKYPEIPWVRVQELLCSKDQEMRDLGKSLVEGKVKYITTIVLSQFLPYESSIIYELEQVVIQYTIANRYNLTEEVL